MADLDISYGTVKEEMRSMGVGADVGDEEDEEEEEFRYEFETPSGTPYQVGQNLINFDNVDDEDEAVPDHDPLSFDDDEDIVILEDGNDPDRTAQGLVLPNDHIDDDEIRPVEVKIGSSAPVQGQNVVHIAAGAAPPPTTNVIRQIVFKEAEKPLLIKSVSSLHECTVGPSCQEEDVANFKSLDMFRCFYCRMNYFVEEDLCRHRKSVMPGIGPDMHPNRNYDPEVEKPFACGVCGKPWNQPRKALACAIFGHDPQTLYWAMFRHDCPMCSERTLRFHSLAAVARHWTLEHPEKPLPVFLLKDWKNDVLPSIKLTKQHFDQVNERNLFYKIFGKKRPLVIENYPPNYCRKRSGGSGIPNKKSRSDSVSSPPKKIRPFRCVTCLQLVSGYVGDQAHSCLKKPDGKIVYSCPRCKARFLDKRTLKLHLMNYCSCFSSPESQTLAERCPYVCIVCKMRFSTLQDLKMHRSLTHLHIPYQPDQEFPFACTICGRPALIEKEAKLCEVFGHDPYSIKKVMFNFRCGECPPNAFGFHSNYALRKHWERDHSHLKLPEKLRGFTEEDVPLPSVTLTLDQLLVCAEKRKNIHPVTEFEFDLSENKQDFILKSRVNGQDASFQVQQIIIADDLPQINTTLPPNEYMSDDGKNECEVCGLSFKNLRRHMKTHDKFRFCGEPKHKCEGCGKGYHVRNSLLCHWKVHANCKMIHNQKMSFGSKTEVQEITLHDSGDEIIQVEERKTSETIPFPVLPSVTDKTVPVAPILSSAQIDQALALMGDDFFGESAPVPASETLTLHYGENSEPTAPTPRLSSVSQTQIPDALVFLPKSKVEISGNPKLEEEPIVEIEIGDVKVACDMNNLNEATTNRKSTKKRKKKEKTLSRRMEDFLTKKPLETRPVRCTLCNLIYPDINRWKFHMDKFHADDFPFKCEQCGKRFNEKFRLKAHLPVHDPNRFAGEPKFACEYCGKKYHLAGSLSTHIAVKHMGMKFKANLTGPILLPRPIWGRNPRAKRFSCHKCPRTFAYKVFLIQHVWRQHVGKVEGGATGKMESKVKQELNCPHACEACEKKFSTYNQLQRHLITHAGEKPHKCLHCGIGFRQRFNLRKHIKTVHEKGDQKTNSSTNLVIPPSRKQEPSKEKIDQAKEFKCIVCGLLFQWGTDLRKHRIIKHANFPSDQEKTKPFGCGVCGKPYIRRSQAIICAMLEHDPTSLQRDMFKHQCSECPENSFGFHSLSFLKKHWLKDHFSKEMPEELVSENVDEDEPLPRVVVDQEKVKEILEKGVPKCDYPFFTEFELLQPPNSKIPEPVLPPPVRIRPTPPIRIRNVRSESRKPTNVKLEQQKSTENPDFYVNIDSVVSLVDSPPSLADLAEVEVEDIKPFIQFIPESLESQTASSSLYEPNDKNIDINEGVPPEFQIRRTSARVSKLKSCKQDGNGSKKSQLRDSSKAKGQSEPNRNERQRQKAISAAKVANDSRQATSLPPPQIPKNDKVQRKKKAKSIGRKKKRARAKQAKKPNVGEKIFLSPSITEQEEESMPIISTEFAVMALASLKTSPLPRLEPEVSKEIAISAPCVKKLDLEVTTSTATKTSGPAILKLLRRPSQNSNSSSSSPATPTTIEEKTDSDNVSLNSSSIPVSLSSPPSIPPTLSSPPSIPPTLSSPLSIPPTLSSPPSIPPTLSSPPSFPPTLSSPPSPLISSSLSTSLLISQPITSPSITNPSASSPPKLLPCSISIHDREAVEKILGRKNLQISVNKIETSETNGRISTKGSGVSALVLQLRNKKRQVRENDGK